MTSVSTRNNVTPSRSGVLPVRAASASRQTHSSNTTTQHSGNMGTSISTSTRTRVNALRNGVDQAVTTTVRSSSANSATRRRPPTHPLTQPTPPPTTTTTTTTPRNAHETIASILPTNTNTHTTGQSMPLQTMDERALERRKRSLELRKKAEENVKSQQEARNQLLWEKERQEAIALEKLKADKRAETMELKHASEAVRDHTVQAQAYLRGLLKKADRFRYLQVARSPFLLPISISSLVLAYLLYTIFYPCYVPWYVPLLIPLLLFSSWSFDWDLLHGEDW